MSDIEQFTPRVGDKFLLQDWSGLEEGETPEVEELEIIELRDRDGQVPLSEFGYPLQWVIPAEEPDTLYEVAWNPAAMAYTVNGDDLL